MLFHVDTSNGFPIYEQIVRQVKFSVASGALHVDQHVPSVRELAATLAVNANTVARAYRELQTEGVLTPVRGTGLAVTADAPKLCKSARQQLVRERLRSVLDEALRSGLAPEEIQGIIDKELHRGASRTT